MLFGVVVKVRHLMNQKTGDNPIPRTRSAALIIFSRVASIIFHPLFMTTIMAVLLNAFLRPDFSRPSSKEFERWTVQLFLYTVVLPFLSILLFRITGLISNAKMHNMKEEETRCRARSLEGHRREHGQRILPTVELRCIAGAQRTARVIPSVAIWLG